MKTNFRISLIISSILVGIAMVSCTTQQPVEQEEKNSLEGVWEYVESFTSDTTYARSPEMKAYKILYGNYFSLAGQNHPEELNWGHAGKIRVTEDAYVEYLDIVRAPEYVGDSVVFKYTLDKDFWIITREGHSEKWKRIE